MKKRVRPDQIIPLLFITGGSLMILSVVTWYAFSSSTLPVTASSNANLFTTSIPAPEITRVSLINAKAAFDKKQAFFIDVRDSGSFAAGHIPGATNISISDLDKHLNEIPRDRWIITYCT
jgi:3-mercaptopyruvate sulfurtransferase SseA